ncbi:hypothetical protein [Arcobacter sp. F2176]|nr:hypothetical protein [Arcobacter sp. F2176]
MIVKFKLQETYQLFNEDKYQNQEISVKLIFKEIKKARHNHSNK